MPHIEPKVLLVEDNVAEARHLRELVGENAVRPIAFQHVTRVSQACARLERGDIAAVVLDLGLPDSAGVDTIAALDAVRRGIPVIVVTGLADDRIRAAASTLGVVHFVEKDELEPVGLTRLLERTLLRSRAPLVAAAVDGSITEVTQEIAGRTHRVRAAIDFCVDCMHKLAHAHEWPLPSAPVRPGVRLRRTSEHAALRRDALAAGIRTLEAAQLELDRMTDRLVDVHRALLRRDLGPE